MASQLTQALQAAAFNGDANATEYMKVQENTNFAVYIHQLCIELGSKDRDVRVRQLAGLQIKNAVDTRSVQAAQTLHNRWKALPDQARSQVKAMLLQILHDEIKDVRGVASLVIGKIASIEVPDKTWPELIPTLDQGITKQSTNMGLRQASLQALGYVCEEVPRGLDEYSSVILGAIAAGMNPAETDNDVKLAATTCLVNSIEFIKNNMDQEADRNNIMKMVFSVTSSPVEAVRAAAFSCLVQIANSYYKYLPPYMGTIFTLTASAIQGQSRDVALNALEFWSTVADVELECMEEDADGAEDPSHRSRSHGIINQAVQTFSPVLLASLTQQNEDIDDDEWGVSLAAGTCLGLCCQVAGNTLVQQALPFINTHVNSENWRFREAAILAFGCILDGPDKDKLLPLVQSAFGVILTKMNDPHPLVRDTTAWTIGRICSLLPEVIDQQNLRPLMDALASGLSQQPKIASNICWAIHNLASSVEPDESNPNTSVLSPYFEPIVGALLRASQRPDVKEANLQVSVYEALNIMITSAAPDVYPLVEKVMPMIMTALDQTLKSGNPNAEAQNEIQALLCGTLQAIITKLPITTIQPQADALMTLFLSVLQSKNSTVHEEALMAVGSVADKVEDGFVKYMAYVKAPLMMGITNAQEWKVCNVAVSVTGDITRAVGPKFTEWSDDVMGVLLRHLQDSTVERTVKSYIIACIGDIALAVGSFFERYMQYVAPMLAQASKTTCDPEDWADVDYTEALRESILEAYSGILLGLAQDNKVAVFVQQRDVIPAIVDLFALIADDKNFTERVLRDAAGLIFDLVRSVGPQIVPTLRTPAVDHILTLACDEKERDNETLRNGLAARKSLQ